MQFADLPQEGRQDEARQLKWNVKFQEIAAVDEFVMASSVCAVLQLRLFAIKSIYQLSKAGKKKSKKKNPPEELQDFPAWTFSE